MRSVYAYKIMPRTINVQWRSGRKFFACNLWCPNFLDKAYVQAIYDLIETEATFGRSIHYAKTYRRGTRASHAAQSLVQLE